MSNSHYFDGEPTVPSNVRQVPLQLGGLSMSLDVDRGVFSATKIDAGTRVLLVEAANPSKHAKLILDLGCGYGPIACVAAKRAPKAQVWATDINTRARDLCAANAKRLGLNVLVAAPEDVPEDLRFDLILSNPPIRVGKKNLHALLELWLDRLKPDGRAELVVQKHLGSDSLQRWLNEQGWPTERLVSRSGYRVLQVRARSQSSRRRAEPDDAASAEGRGTDHETASDPANAGSSRRRAEPDDAASAEGRGTDHETASDPANAGSSRRRAEER